MYLIFTVLAMIPGINTTPRNAVLCQWMKINRAILDMEITPPKFNMEPENDGF